MSADISGIVSYAGQSLKDLLASARAFMQSVSDERIAAFLPLFPEELIVNMEYVGIAPPPALKPSRDMPPPPAPRVNACGFSIDPAYYFGSLFTRMPELCAGENRARLFDYTGAYTGRGEVAVDEKWAEVFSWYTPFLGERLHIYPIGGGAQAVAVPESIYPRCGCLLREAETAMGVTRRALSYAEYARGRAEAGEGYDDSAFIADHMLSEGLSPTSLSRRELARIYQGLSIAGSALAGEKPEALYTEGARLARRVRQYAPYRCACDNFDSCKEFIPRVAQLCYDENDDIGDIWLPYAMLGIKRPGMTIDARGICRSFQIPPRYDPATGGGVYPGVLRVAALRSRELEMLWADAINNPAYGEGMGADGIMRRLLCIPGSAEHARRGRMAIEVSAGVNVVNTAVSREEFARMTLESELQELKGRLSDALYRRESALSQLETGSPAYSRVDASMSAKADRLKKLTEKRASALTPVRVSGYDADIDYLERKRLSREHGKEFSADAQREKSVERGYAMRLCAVRAPL